MGKIRFCLNARFLQKVCEDRKFVAEVHIQEHDPGDQPREYDEPQKVAPGESEFFILRSPLGAAVTAGVHRVAQIFRTAEGGYEQRNEHGDHRLGALDQPARFEIGPARLLRSDDAVGFVEQGGDKAERDAHDERQLVHGEFDVFERFQQAFDAVGERHGRRREGEHRSAHDQQKQPEREKDHVDDGFIGDRDDPPMHEGLVRAFPSVKEQVEDRRKDDEEQDHLHRAQHAAEGHAREQHDEDKERRDRRQTEKVGGEEDRHDIGDHEHDLRARVHVVDERSRRIILAERYVIEHLRPPLSRGTAKALSPRNRRR